MTYKVNLDNYSELLDLLKDVANKEGDSMLTFDTHLRLRWALYKFYAIRKVWVKKVKAGTAWDVVMAEKLAGKEGLEKLNELADKMSRLTFHPVGERQLAIRKGTKAVITHE